MSDYLVNKIKEAERRIEELKLLIKEWKKKPYECMTSVEMMDVMKQYEKTYLWVITRFQIILRYFFDLIFSCVRIHELI